MYEKRLCASDFNHADEILKSDSSRWCREDIGWLFIATNMLNAYQKIVNKLTKVVYLHVDLICSRGGLLMCCKL